MISATFKTLRNGEIRAVNCAELIQGRRVLFCSVTRPVEYLTHHYIAYLKDQEQQYKNNNLIDQLVLITTQPWALATLETYFPEMLTVLDSDKQLLTYLKQIQNKKQSLHWLSRLWQYQALFNNGELVHFTEQPTEDRKNKVIDNLKQNPTIFKNLLANNNDAYLFKNLFKESEELIFDRECFFEFVNEHRLYNLLYFYQLWPNQSLNTYLNRDNHLG